MKRIKMLKTLALFVCLTLLFSSLPVSAYIFNEEIEVSSSVISSELLQHMATISNNDTIDVAVWQYDIDYALVEELTFEKTGLRKADITDEMDIETVQNYIQTKRQIASTMYQKLNNQFNKDILSKQSGNTVLFQSKYSPMTVLTMKKENVLKTATSAIISSIDYVDNSILSEICSSTANSNIGATYLRETSSINATGAGIKIGMIENGLPDLTTGYFTNTKMHLVNDQYTAADEEYRQKYIEHATLVAAIMVGKSTTYGDTTYRGVAPDADLYYGTSSTKTHFYNLVEQFIDLGVNIINRSGGFSSNGVYSDITKWVDHIAFQHDIHFVAAAGNFSNNDIYVLTPGLGFNVITVGNASDGDGSLGNNIVAPSDISNLVLSGTALSDRSSYKATYNGTEVYKPDICAYGTNIQFAALEKSGTSFSAPQVTGIVAQLCQKYSSLLTDNSGVKAILATSAMYKTETNAGTRHNNTILYDKMGAGIVNARCAYNIKYAGKVHNATLSPTATTYTFTINVPSSYDYLRLGMTWIKKNSVSGSQHENSTATDAPLADYKLEIYYGTNTSGTARAFSDAPCTNLEILQFTPTQYGTYTVKVTLNNPADINTYQYLSFAWY